LLWLFIPIYLQNLRFCFFSDDHIFTNSNHLDTIGALAAYYLFPKKLTINIERTIDIQLTLFYIRRTDT